MNWGYLLVFEVWTDLEADSAFPSQSHTHTHTQTQICISKHGCPININCSQWCWNSFTLSHPVTRPQLLSLCTHPQQVLSLSLQSVCSCALGCAFQIKSNSRKKSERLSGLIPEAQQQREAEWGVPAACCTSILRWHLSISSEVSIDREQHCTCYHPIKGFPLALTASLPR